MFGVLTKIKLKKERKKGPEATTRKWIRLRSGLLRRLGLEATTRTSTSAGLGLEPPRVLASLARVLEALPVLACLS